MPSLRSRGEEDLIMSQGRRMDEKEEEEEERRVNRIE